MPRRPQLTLPELRAEVARLEAKYDFEMKPFRVEYDASRNDELRYQILDKGGDGWVGHTPDEVLTEFKETIYRWFGDMNPNGSSSVFRRGQAQAADDAEAFGALRNKESAAEVAAADARIAPGEEPARFRSAKAKSSPTTSTEQQIVAEIEAGPLPLGFVSNALLYSRALRHLMAREKQALYSLVKGGALDMVRAGPPDGYWLVTRGHTPNSGYYVWVMGRGDTPLDEPALGPHDLQTAKTMARIAATKGVHDRAVSLGVQPLAQSFKIVRRYRARTGERIV